MILAARLRRASVQQFPMRKRELHFRRIRQRINSGFYEAVI